MEGVAGSPRPVRSGSAGGGAVQHSVQPAGEDLGRLTVLAAPAADGWRWASNVTLWVNREDDTRTIAKATDQRVLFLQMCYNSLTRRYAWEPACMTPN